MYYVLVNKVAKKVQQNTQKRTPAGNDFKTDIVACWLIKQNLRSE